MNDPEKPIENFFLESLFKISFVSIIVVTAVDFYFTGFVVAVSLAINAAVFFAIGSSVLLYRLGHYKTSVVWIGSVIVAAMFYQSFYASTITTSSMAVVMVVGFGYSVLLKGRLSFVLHVVLLVGMIGVFSWMSFHSKDYGKETANDIIVAGVTYGVLYLTLAYSAAFLKNRYDEAFVNLESKNTELVEKSNEIETQNEELVQSQEKLSELNNHLETLVEQRTREVKRQNEQLINYAHANAHHLRGPVARLLGLIQLSKLDKNMGLPDLFEKIEEQGNEIDDVVKKINAELESR